MDETLDPPSPRTDPKRGELWWVRLDPREGSELEKTRPGVVISSDGIRKLPVRLVAPLTDWKPAFQTQAWKVLVHPTDENGLRKTGAVDVMQTRVLDLKRFGERMGRLTPEVMAEVAAAVAIAVEFE